MTKHSVPLGVPVKLCCKGVSSKAKKEVLMENVRILLTSDGKYMIQSTTDQRNLFILSSGECVFINRNSQQGNRFEVESDAKGNLYFISCLTGNVLQCSESGRVFCKDASRSAWSQWKLSIVKHRVLPAHIGRGSRPEYEVVSKTNKIGFEKKKLQEELVDV